MVLQARFPSSRLVEARTLPEALAGGTLENLQTVVFDGFNRADSASALGNAETGQAWNLQTTVWGIASGKAYNASGSSYHYATVEGPVRGDMVVSCVLTRGSAFQAGLLLRWSDSSNYVTAWVTATATRISKVVAGTLTNVVNATYTWVDGATLTAVVQGPMISLYRNDLPIVIPAHIPEFASGRTRQGIVASTTNDQGARFDDFTVKALV